MSDPVIDEEEIIALLKAPVSPETVARLQQGAIQALLDIYDRKVTRDQFIDMASPCIALYGQMAKLWIMANVRMSYYHGDVDEVRINAAIDGLEKLARVQAESVIEVVKRLQMCPTSQDRIN